MMGNIRNSAAATQDSTAVIKFWHATAGLYIWEFITTLDYEWSVIRGYRPYPWTIVIYSITRVATLIAVILWLIGMDVTTEYNCQVETIFQYLSGYLAISTASLLIVFRIIAIWNRKKLVIAITAGVWVANLGFHIQSIVRIRAIWVSAVSTCVTVNLLSTKLNMITTLTTDIILLLIMLIGLLRLGFHRDESGIFGLGHHMWRQGLIWLFLSTIAEVPPVVFISLNLNEQFNYLFQLPAAVTLSIAATRIYRSLLDFSSSSTDIAIITDKHQPINFVTSKTDRVPGLSITPETREVTVHKTYEEYQASQTTTSSRNASFISVEGSLRDTQAGLELDYRDDIERGAESGT